MKGKFMDKIYIDRVIICDFIKNPNLYDSKTPEGAILRTAYSNGIKFRHIKGGWTEFCDKTQRWIVYKVWVYTYK